MLDAIRDLVPLLGRPRTRANGRTLFELLGCQPLVRSFPRVSADVYWEYPGAGLSALWSAGRLRAWFLYGSARPEGSAFPGRLDGGLSARAARSEIHRVWGPPQKAFKLESARQPWRDSYERPDCKILIEYSSGRQEEVRAVSIMLQREYQPAVVKRSGKARVSRAGAALRCTFRCARCGRRAETVSLVRQEPDPVVRHGFGGNRMGVTGADAARLEALLLAGDAAALHAFRPMVAASYCPKCRTCYCLRHWQGRHGAPPHWGDEISWDWVEYGACPYGHERILRD